MHALIENTSLQKNANYHIKLQQVMVSLTVEGLTLMYWLLTDQDAGCERLGWLWQFLKSETTLPFINDFSIACNAI